MTSETKPRRKRRFLKILLLLLAVMIVIVILLPTIASTAMGKSWVTGRLASSLDRDVTLGDFEAGWGSGLTFSGLRVANPEGFSPEALFSAGSLLLKPGLASALGGDLDVVIELRDATLRVEKSADGRLNTDGMLKPEEKKDEPADAKKEPSGSMSLRVVIENFSMTYVDLGKPEGERETVVQDLDLDLTLDGSDPASIAGALTATIQRVATASGLESEVVSISGKAENGVLALEQVSVPLGGGNVVASGKLDLAKGKAFQAGLEVKDVHLARGFPFLDYVLPIFALGEGGGTAEGTLNAKVSLDGAGLDFDSLVKHLTGEGTFKVSKGRIRGNSIVARALQLAGEQGALGFDEVESGFKIENGRVHTPKVKLGEGALRLRLMGSVGLDGSVDYVLGMKPKGSTWKTIRKELGEDGVIPIRISGSIGNLDVEEPDPQAMLKKLLDRKTGGLLEDLIGK